MKFQVFSVPVLQPDDGLDKLNKFITQNRVCSVDKEFLSNGADSCWAFCVKYLDDQGPLNAKNTAVAKRIDYKEVLSEADFQLYARLREWRKTVAEREATPAYNVFTNEQLATIVTQRISNKTQLKGVDGIGQSRLEKYADEVLRVFCSLINKAEPASETP